MNPFNFGFGHCSATGIPVSAHRMFNYGKSERSRQR
jgi:hypothetical protein